MRAAIKFPIAQREKDDARYTVNKKKPERSKLAPCPFDGGKARFLKLEGHLAHAVECRVCHARTARFRLQWMAAERWNQRT